MCNKIAVICVGNKLMLDDGVGPAAYEELTQCYIFPDNVSILEVGCMSLAMVNYVSEMDYIISVDAVDGTDSPAGTVFEFDPYDMAPHTTTMASLHDLKLVDLFSAASLMGYSAEGRCFGVQVENRSPEIVTIGLTQKVYDAIPLLIDAVLAHLVALDVKIVHKQSGNMVLPGWHHEMGAL
jgi:hydrogenase maturation protease